MHQRGRSRRCRRASGFSAGLWPHEHEIRSGIAVLGDKAKLRLDVGDAPAFAVFGDDEPKQRAADAVVTHSGGFRFGDSRGKVTIGDLGCGHPGFLFLPLCHPGFEGLLICVKCCRASCRCGALSSVRLVRHIHATTFNAPPPIY